MENNEKNNGILSEIMEYVRIVIVVVIAVFLVNTFLVINARIPSASMESTIMEGDRLFGNRLAYKSKDPERLDIVIFRFPDDPKQLYIKRVIGLPGETVEVIDGKVYINGSSEPLPDDFINEKEYYETDDWGPYEVPEDGFFVMGDNRFDSWDSRYWENTFVTRDAILGKAVFRYFPFTRLGTVH